MLVFLSGGDPLLAKQAIDQIKGKYIDKNPDSVELIEIDEATSEPNWADLGAVPLFATSRLFVIRRLGDFNATSLAALPRFLAGMPTSTVVAAWDRKPVAQKELKEALAQADKTINVSTPEGPRLVSWATKRALQLGVNLSREDIAAIVDPPPHDLWEIETTLRQLITGVRPERSNQANSEPFIFFTALRRGNWELVKEEIVKKHDLGEPMELTIGSLAAAIRKQVNDRVAKKALLGFLLDIDLGLKTGQLASGDASALLVAHLPSLSSNRVQWESAWGETRS